MADTLYIIDAMAYAFRSYYAIRSNLSNAAGKPTNAVYGFTRILMKLLREENPSHVVVVFDAPGKTFRDDLYADYKATRPDTPEDLLIQFPMMQEVVRAMNLPMLSVPGVEADDVMGTLAVQAAAHEIPAVLVTGDKDMLQLIGPSVRVYDPAKGDNGKWYGHEDVVERFGVGPEGVIDALALIGDSADNVPGVKGIGEKTAKKLLGKYGSMENLYAHVDELKGKQKENLINDRDQAYTSRELVTIKTDVPLDLAYEDWLRKPPERDALIATFSELEFSTLLEELLPDEEAPETAEELAYELVLDEAALAAVIERIRKVGAVALDTETTSTDPMQAELVGVSLSCAAGSAWYIPVAHCDEALQYFEDPEDLTTLVQQHPIPREKALDMLRPALEDARIGKIGHNIKYDLVVLERAGVSVQGVILDTMIASYLTDSSRLRHNLDELSLQHLKRKLTPISDLIGKGAKTTTFDKVPLNRACTYACEDAEVTWRLADIFQKALDQRQLRKLFDEVELPLLHVLMRMERCGVKLDPTVFATLHQEINERLSSLNEAIFESAGESFNINSPKQLQGILFNKLGLKPVRKTKTGYSTDERVLETLADKHPLPALILEYRSLEKLRGTYVETLPKLVNPATGRVHTSYNQAIAATGRLSSSDPNLQNIPIRSDLGRRIREGFVAGKEDFCLISADYSQIELRVLAHLAGDEGLLDSFRRDADIHTETAARIYQVPPEEVSGEMRRQAKAVNFGVIYGISAFGLARNIKISNKEASVYIEAYFKQFPGVKAWIDATLAQAREDGYVSTLLGRRRYLPDLKSSNPQARNAAERMAMNTPVQGSAADIIKLAMLAVDREQETHQASMLLQVHDELVLEAPASNAEAVAEWLRQVMEAAYVLKAPLKVDVGIGKNWAEIH